jgi:hypothetical protein
MDLASTVTQCRKKSPPTVGFRRLEQCDIYCKYRRWRPRFVALLHAVSHFSLAICPEPISSLLYACCFPTRPARDVACPPYARGQECWPVRQEPTCITSDACPGDTCLWSHAGPRPAYKRRLPPRNSRYAPPCSSLEGCGSRSARLSSFQQHSPLEDREHVTYYVTTFDGGVPLARYVTSPPVNRRGKQPRGGQTSGESPRASWSWRGR